MAKIKKRPVPVTLFGIQYPEEVRILWRNTHGHGAHDFAIKKAFIKAFPGEKISDIETMEKRLRERVNHFACGCPGAETIRDQAKALKLSTYYLEV